mmetsp:Transcript_24169/g.40956  ORF Transcript_24169/g.40956 Transcript_24169/m.40956 type:complete len:88 (+) Transcript_24169:517-780(+)
MNLLLQTLIRVLSMEMLLPRTRNAAWASEVCGMAAWCSRLQGAWKYIKGHLFPVFAVDLEHFQCFYFDFNLRLLCIGIVTISIIDTY